MASEKKKLIIFWFRRDLRLDDNAGLYYALKQNVSVLPLFIFDSDILDNLPKADARVTFIHQTLERLKSQLQALGSDLQVEIGKPKEVFAKLTQDLKIQDIYTNHDYEPYASTRDGEIRQMAEKNGIAFKTFKDQVIFEKSEVLNGSGENYVVFTPYKNKWLSQLNDFYLKSYPTLDYKNNFLPVQKALIMPTLAALGFKISPILFPSESLNFAKVLKNYGADRDFPAKNGTSHLGIHLRFGTISVRKLAQIAKKYSDVYLSEIIWRDFFMHILWHYPNVLKKSFRAKYENINWRTNAGQFESWCCGETGYPLVDAGMRELNQTGFMHNRVRMVTASFLTKHLLMHWSLGERYFAEKLLDYDLAANNGNWQWAAGTGCDAAPYFRVFNPTAQLKKFDPDFEYVLKWVPEFQTTKYVNPIVEHEAARVRALATYKEGLNRE